MADAPSGLHFEIDSWVVFQLGEQLVTDVVQALVELVKNCYDADATYAKVAIITNGSPGDSFHYADASGYILIDDNGFGMTRDRIQDGWLFISNSYKRGFKAEKKVSPRGRTPLGDKGLGRLCTQRLGSNVEIVTRSDGPEGRAGGYHVAFSWADFATGRSLSDVTIFSEPASKTEKGTSLVISGLKDIEQWNSGSALHRLQTGLSRLLSPFQLVRDFFVTVTVDGVPLPLADISNEVRNAATLRYAMNSDGGVFTVNGRMRLDFVRPPVSQKQDQERFKELVDADNGAAFLAYLMEDGRARDMGFRKSKRPWFLEFGVSRPLEDMPGIARIEGELANPGPFKGEVDSFDLGDETGRPTDVFNTAAEFRDYISQMHGIRVYRDGFGIRVDDDWLGLGKQWTKAKSYYTLKPANTLGFVAISARDNPTLQETTNREGFTDTPYYRTFFALLQEFVRLSGNAQEFVRRGWLRFKAQHPATPAGEEPVSAPAAATAEELAERMRQRLAAATAGTERLKAIGSTLETALTHCADAIKTASVEGADATPEVKAALKEVEDVVGVFQGVRAEVERGAAEVEQIRQLGEQVTGRMEGLREQLADMYETVGLGLTAEALSHEIAEIATGLAGRTQNVKRKLETDGVKNKALTSYLAHVTSSVAALRKQLQHLAPSLKYVRHQREDIDLADFTREMAEYHKPRQAGAGIRMEVVGNGFKVHMNRGRLTQAFDNVCLNCEYWLKQEIAAKRLKDGGVITVSLDRPFLRISDNGRGIDPTVEASLFEPFITAKPRGQGRGLGLFITKQLLDGDRCRIGLVQKRNSHKRFYIFEIDLGGAVNDVE